VVLQHDVPEGTVEVRLDFVNQNDAILASLLRLLGHSFEVSLVKLVQMTSVVHYEYCTARLDQLTAHQMKEQGLS
jgi:hypothetical protein